MNATELRKRIQAQDKYETNMCSLVVGDVAFHDNEILHLCSNYSQIKILLQPFNDDLVIVRGILTDQIYLVNINDISSIRSYKNGEMSINDKLCKPCAVKQGTCITVTDKDHPLYNIVNSIRSIGNFPYVHDFHGCGRYSIETKSFYLLIYMLVQIRHIRKDVGPWKNINKSSFNDITVLTKID